MPALSTRSSHYRPPPPFADTANTETHHHHRRPPPSPLVLSGPSPIVNTHIDLEDVLKQYYLPLCQYLQQRAEAVQSGSSDSGDENALSLRSTSQPSSPTTKSNNSARGRGGAFSFSTVSGAMSGSQQILVGEMETDVSGSTSHRNSASQSFSLQTTQPPTPMAPGSPHHLSILTLVPAGAAAPPSRSPLPLAPALSELRRTESLLASLNEQENEERLIAAAAALSPRRKQSGGQQEDQVGAPLRTTFVPGWKSNPKRNLDALSSHQMTARISEIDNAVRKIAQYWDPSSSASVVPASSNSSSPTWSNLSSPTNRRPERQQRVSFHHNVEKENSEEELNVFSLQQLGNILGDLVLAAADVAHIAGWDVEPWLESEHSGAGNASTVGECLPWQPAGRTSNVASPLLVGQFLRQRRGSDPSPSASPSSMRYQPPSSFQNHPAAAPLSSFSSSPVWVQQHAHRFTAPPSTNELGSTRAGGDDNTPILGLFEPTGLDNMETSYLLGSMDQEDLLADMQSVSMHASSPVAVWEMTKEGVTNVMLERQGSFARRTSSLRQPPAGMGRHSNSVGSYQRLLSSRSTLQGSQVELGPTGGAEIPIPKVYTTGGTSSTTNAYSPQQRPFPASVFATPPPTRATTATHPITQEEEPTPTPDAGETNGNTATATGGVAVRGGSRRAADANFSPLGSMTFKPALSITSPPDSPRHILRSSSSTTPSGYSPPAATEYLMQTHQEEGVGAGQRRRVSQTQPTSSSLPQALTLTEPLRASPTRPTVYIVDQALLSKFLMSLAVLQRQLQSPQTTASRWTSFEFDSIGIRYEIPGIRIVDPSSASSPSRRSHSTSSPRKDVSTQHAVRALPAYLQSFLIDDSSAAIDGGEGDHNMRAASPNGSPEWRRMSLGAKQVQSHDHLDSLAESSGGSSGAAAAAAARVVARLESGSTDVSPSHSNQRIAPSFVLPPSQMSTQQQQQYTPPPSSQPHRAVSPSTAASRRNGTATQQADLGTSTLLQQHPKWLPLLPNTPLVQMNEFGIYVAMLRKKLGDIDDDTQLGLLSQYHSLLGVA